MAGGQGSGEEAPGRRPRSCWSRSAAANSAGSRPAALSGTESPSARRCAPPSPRATLSSRGYTMRDAVKCWSTTYGQLDAGDMAVHQKGGSAARASACATSRARDRRTESTLAMIQSVVRRRAGAGYRCGSRGGGERRELRPAGDIVDHRRIAGDDQVRSAVEGVAADRRSSASWKSTGAGRSDFGSETVDGSGHGVRPRSGPGRDRQRCGERIRPGWRWTPTDDRRRNGGVYSQVMNVRGTKAATT